MVDPELLSILEVWCRGAAQSVLEFTGNIGKKHGCYLKIFIPDMTLNCSQGSYNLVDRPVCKLIFDESLIVRIVGWGSIHSLMWYLSG